MKIKEKMGVLALACGVIYTGGYIYQLEKKVDEPKKTDIEQVKKEVSVQLTEGQYKKNNDGTFSYIAKVKNEMNKNVLIKELVFYYKDGDGSISMKNIDIYKEKEILQPNEEAYVYFETVKPKEKNMKNIQFYIEADVEETEEKTSKNTSSFENFLEFLELEKEGFEKMDSESQHIAKKKIDKINLLSENRTVIGNKMYIVSSYANETENPIKINKVTLKNNKEKITEKINVYGTDIITEGMLFIVSQEIDLKEINKEDVKTKYDFDYDENKEGLGKTSNGEFYTKNIRIETKEEKIVKENDKYYLLANIENKPENQVSGTFVLYNGEGENQRPIKTIETTIMKNQKKIKIEIEDGEYLKKHTTNIIPMFFEK